MTALAKLRTERGLMSAMDRRIADFILANSQLLRDYSSQQLADALKISQSSVVKFAQRLGYKGYPDLKLSITEAVARAAAVNAAGHVAAASSDDPDTHRSDALWLSKTAAVRETRGLVSAPALVEAARWLADAEMLYVAGDGIDGEAARGFASRIALLGHRAVAHGQPHDLIAGLSAATPRDLLLLICGHGGAEWMRACREMRAAGGHVLVIARRPGRLAATANVCLAVSAHDAHPHVEDLVYEATMRQLLDDLFLRVVAMRPDSLETFVTNRRRMLDGAEE